MIERGTELERASLRSAAALLRTVARVARIRWRIVPALPFSASGVQDTATFILKMSISSVSIYG